MRKWEQLFTEMKKRIEACQQALLKVQQLEIAFKIPLEFWEKVKACFFPKTLTTHALRFIFIK